MRVIFPKNMGKTVFDHLRTTGRQVEIREGSEVGWLNPERHKLIGLRSADIPVTVEHLADIGFCGSDWIEEQRLKTGVTISTLGVYQYGRKSLIAPVLELITTTDKALMDPEDIKPGELVITEYPELTQDFFTKRRIPCKHIDDPGAPKLPEKFIPWCRERGLVGIRTVHGGVAALVAEGAGFGTMVSESGDTKAEYGLASIATMYVVNTLLVADRGSLRNRELRPQIDELAYELNEAYRRMSREGAEDHSRGRCI